MAGRCVGYHGPSALPGRGDAARSLWQRDLNKDYRIRMPIWGIFRGTADL